MTSSGSSHTLRKAWAVFCWRPKGRHPVAIHVPFHALLACSCTAMLHTWPFLPGLCMDIFWCNSCLSSKLQVCDCRGSTKLQMQCQVMPCSLSLSGCGRLCNQSEGTEQLMADKEVCLEAWNA